MFCVCRPSSKWELGGDTIHEEQVYETDNEHKTSSLPRARDMFADHSVDLSRWRSTDRLKSLCKGIDLTQTTDDEVQKSQSLPRSVHRKEGKTHHRIKPWLNVCKTIISTKGFVTIKELVDICEKRKAHFTSRQDQEFQGFESTDELLDCMGVATEKVRDASNSIWTDQGTSV